MLKVVSEEEIRRLVAPILTTSEEEMSTEAYQALVIDACRFYGAAIYLQSLMKRERDALRIAYCATKSYCDDYLVGKHGVSMFWAHSATNECTQNNLPAVEIGKDDLADFTKEGFFIQYRSMTT